MTAPEPADTPSPAAPPPAWLRHRVRIERLAAALRRRDFPTGDAAALRRLDPTRPTLPGILAVERTLNAVLTDSNGNNGTPDDPAPANPTTRAPGGLRWTWIVHCLALARGRHERSARAGDVLADIGYSDARLATLLDRHFQVAAPATARLARQLHQKGAAIDWTPFTELLLTTGISGPAAAAAERHRHHVARQYARATAQRST